jgi:hypothetical protein
MVKVFDSSDILSFELRPQIDREFTKMWEKALDFNYTNYKYDSSLNYITIFVASMII